MVTTSMFISNRLFVVVSVTVILCANIDLSTGATQAEERASQDVKLKLYDLSTSDWSTSKKNTFSAVIATQATVYCNNSPSSCGLDSAITITSSQVGTSSPEADGSSIEFTFYIDYPGGAVVTAGGATTHVLPKSAVEDIAADARDEVKDQVGYYITYIGDEYYSIPPDGTTNKIIIPIAFLVVVAIGLSPVVMHKYQKNKARQMKIQQRKERKKQYGGTNNVLDSTNTTILTTITPRPTASYNNNNNGSPRVGSDHRDTSKKTTINYEMWTVASEPVSLSKAKPLPSVNEFHEGHADEGIEVRTNMLEPLTRFTGNGGDAEDEEARKERKRRRREKRKEKKRREQEAAMEMQYENPGFNSSNLSDGSNLPPSVEIDD